MDPSSPTHPTEPLGPWIHMLGCEPLEEVWSCSVTCVKTCIHTEAGCFIHVVPACPRQCAHMYVCVCICMCACSSIRLCICVCSYLASLVLRPLQLCRCLAARMCGCACVHVYVPVPGSLCLCACVCVCHTQGTSRDEYGRLVLGDIIRTVNGSTIKNSSDLYRILDKAKVRVRMHT